jgi:26S proteasome regulatory subunit N5
MHNEQNSIGHPVPQGKLTQCLEALLNLEKTARLAEDVTACKASCSAILEVCHKAKDWKQLEEQIVLLAKRRGQLKQVIQAFVRQAMGYISSAPSKETQVSLIKTLQTVTEGKVRQDVVAPRSEAAAPGSTSSVTWFIRQHAEVQ